MVAYVFLALGMIATAALASASHHGHNDYYAKPKYHFKYGVDDHKHGDHHSQWEERDGDKVKGGYSIKDADGTWRHVSYTSDKENGFNAVVERHGKAVHPHHHHHHHHHSHDFKSDKADYAVAESTARAGSGPAVLDVGHEAMERYPDAAYGYIQ